MNKGSGMQDAEITKSLAVHVLGGYNWLKNSVYFCIIKCMQTVKQKVWSKAKNVGLHASLVWDSYATLNDFNKKNLTVLQFLGGTLL